MITLIKSSILMQWAVAITASLAAVTAGQGFGWPLPALLKIREGDAGFRLTETEESWMVTVVFIGNLLSPVPSGYVMDQIGRRTALLVFVFLMILSWGLVIGAHTAVGLYLARFLAGLWAGVIYTIAPIYLGEVMEPRMRGPAGSLFSVGLFIGSIYESAIGPWVSYDLLALVSVAVPVIFFCCMFLAPESPYYLLMRGDEVAARNSLISLRRRPDVEEELSDMKESVKMQLTSKGSFAKVFETAANRKAFLIVQTVCGVQRLAGLTLLVTYTSVFLPQSFIPVSLGVLLVNVDWLVFSILGMWTLSKFGRKTMFIISCGGGFITMTLMGAWYLLRDNLGVDVSSYSWVPLVTLLVHGVFYALGIVSVPGVLQGELFSVSVKAKSSALASLNMAILSGIIVKVYSPISATIGLAFNFFIAALSSLLGLLFAIFVLFETKGKTLQEIQDILSKKHVKTNDE